MTFHLWNGHLVYHSSVNLNLRFFFVFLSRHHNFLQHHPGVSFFFSPPLLDAALLCEYEWCKSCRFKSKHFFKTKGWRKNPKLIDFIPGLGFDSLPLAPVKYNITVNLHKIQDKLQFLDRKPTSTIAAFQTGPLSWWSWNLEMLHFLEGGKLAWLGKTLKARYCMMF